ncbi:solute symporter family protein [Natronobacterium gregoryi]|uniref:Cation acetate symporter n=2 Tax=Natronobacterium gregoryi TaxID=44930 RepID=L0AEC4_NATGS|nr:VC_2705 family sodium/solute symporter [Natronobacterium gregoryi]AFZ71779.1 putative sodium:solute symporter, VC_2705 subfamily [Natronobacterium gregoryi SP2]ELY72836.1 sodium symporter protein [Natronobacterium gregoryi SP2]PLK21040.1 cation acetate symporter [Natronobacterium gregoryi SP2]SFI88020.1 cation/acetate symporter [Natronobacterium gregoryi]
MIEPVTLQYETAVDIGFKAIPALTIVAMMVLFLGVGYFFRVAAVDDLWVAGRSIGAIENGMAIGANWMSAASYLGVAALIATAGYYGLGFVVGWTTGYFILLIFMAAQFRRFGKYTAPDFVGDRFYSNYARGIAAFVTLVIAFVYAIGQGSGMGLMAQYILGLSYEAGVILFMGVTIVYVALSGMLGATKNMALQYVILILAFLLGLYVVGWSQGWSTVMPYLEAGAQTELLIEEFHAQFAEPFAAESFYMWMALVVSLILGTCGLPHVLVRFYTVDNERTARWSTVWGLFFICLLYWGTATYAVFGGLLYEEPVSGDETAVTAGAEDTFMNMPGADGDALVALTVQLADMPEWLVGIVAAGAVAAALATTAGLFVSASSAAAHDIYTNLYKTEATQREQMAVGRTTILVIGILVTLIALNPPALIGELVAMSFAIAACVFFPVFFLGLWWENATQEGAIAGMLVGILVSFGAIANDTAIPMYTGVEGAFSTTLAAYVPGLGSALVGVPVVFAVIIVVSLVTESPPEHVKRLVRQCHSPKPMDKMDAAEDVAADGGTTTDD